MNATENTASTIHQEVLAEDAYKRIEKELLALAADDVLTINLDIGSAASTAIGCIPKLVSLKGQLEQELRKFDVSLIDKLEGYTYGLLYAHSVYQCETHSPEDLQQLLESGIRLRGLLHSDATALIRRGLLSEESIRDYDGLTGYINVANDLQMFCTALGSHWGDIAGRCAATKDELDFASRMAGRIIRLVGERDQTTARVEDAADKRSRAFTLFFNCYDEIQRGVCYVRWPTGDADEYAPSLHTTSHKTRRSDKDAKDAEPVQPGSPAPVVPTPVNQSLNSPSPFMPAGAPAPTRTGIPGGSPYVQ